MKLLNTFQSHKHDIIQPSVYLVSTRLDFATIFTEFCDAKMWVYDSFRFGLEKTFQRLLFSSSEICFPGWVSLFLHQY